MCSCLFGVIFYWDFPLCIGDEVFLTCTFCFFARLTEGRYYNNIYLFSPVVALFLPFLIDVTPLRFLYHLELPVNGCVLRCLGGVSFGNRSNCFIGRTWAVVGPLRFHIKAAHSFVFRAFFKSSLKVLVSLFDFLVGELLRRSLSALLYQVCFFAVAFYCVWLGRGCATLVAC